MNYEFTGKLIEKGETEQISEQFRKRSFVLLSLEQSGSATFENPIKFQVINFRCDLLDRVQIGDQLKVSFAMRGQRSEKDGRVNYFQNNDVWKISRVQVSEEVLTTENAQSVESPVIRGEHETPLDGANKVENDLPI